MEELALKLVKEILEGNRRCPGRIEKIELNVRNEIMLPRKGVAPGIYYKLTVDQGGPQSLEFSAGFHCRTHSGNKYRRANEVATEVYSYFAARNIPVSVTGNAFEV